MEQLFYHYQDSKAMTASILAWLQSPESHNCSSLRLCANCSLSEEATLALVQSPLANTIRAMEFTEIYFSPQQLEQLLSMPALVEMRIYGGVSYDWNGPEYSYPTLELEHIAVFETSPHAKRLQALALDRQNLGEATGLSLRAALPQLQSLWVEGKSYQNQASP